MSGTVSGTTRELACLTLGHDEDDLPACPSSDEDLVRGLVEEVQRLRVAAGIVEESDLDRQERIEAVADAYEDDRFTPDVFAHAHSTAETLLAVLDESGWTLHPVRRP